jgi:hypothetical protein
MKEHAAEIQEPLDKHRGISKIHYTLGVEDQNTSDELIQAIKKSHRVENKTL